MYLSVIDACDALRSSRWTISRLIDAGELSAIKGPHPKSPYKIDAASVRAYLDRHTINPNKERQMSATTGNLPALYSLAEVAETYRISLLQLERDARNKKFTHIRRGRQRFLTEAQLKAFFAAHTEAGEGGVDPEAATRARVARIRQGRSVDAPQGHRDVA